MNKEQRQTKTNYWLGQEVVNVNIFAPLLKIHVEDNLKPIKIKVRPYRNIDPTSMKSVINCWYNEEGICDFGQ